MKYEETIFDTRGKFLEESIAMEGDIKTVFRDITWDNMRGLMRRALTSEGDLHKLPSERDMLVRWNMVIGLTRTKMRMSNYHLYRIVGSAKSVFHYAGNVPNMNDLLDAFDSIGNAGVIHFEGKPLDKVIESWYVRVGSGSRFDIAMAQCLMIDGLRKYLPICVGFDMKSGYTVYDYLLGGEKPITNDNPAELTTYHSRVILSSIVNLYKYKETSKHVTIFDISKVKKEMDRVNSPSKKQARAELIDDCSAKKIILIGPRKVQLNRPENNKSSHIGWHIKHSFEVSPHIRMQWVGSLGKGTRRQEPIHVRPYKKGVGLPEQEVEYLVKGAEDI